MSEPLIPEFQLWGAAREAALSKFRQQVADWGLAMPEVEALVIDFGLKEFDTTGLIEYWIVNDEQAGYCGKFLFLFDGQTCPEHHHNMKHETFFILKGRVKMVVNGAARNMAQGDRLAMPPGERHTFTGLGNALVLEVSLPSIVKDNYFADKRLMGGYDAK